MSIAYVLPYISFTKQQFVVNHRYTVLQETGEKKKLYILPNRPTPQHAMFLRIYKRSNFYGHSILTEGVFVTQLSSCVRTSV